MALLCLLQHLPVLIVCSPDHLLACVQAYPVAIAAGFGLFLGVGYAVSTFKYSPNIL